MPRALIYARLSQDRNGQSTSTARQVAACEAWAAARSWEVAGKYVDADLSAFKGVARPQYDAMLEAVSEGDGDVVLAWKLDRLLRRPRDFERLWAMCEDRGANIATVEDGIDTSAAFVGKLLPRLMAIFAEMESESISVRTRSKAAEIAKAGRHHGGGTRPFGLSADWSEIVQPEADALREAADRVLAGESLRGVAMDLNQRGITTSTGGLWKPETLRQMLVSPRVAGLRTHHGTVVGRDGYPAILSEDTYRRLDAALRQGNRSRGPQARKYLLSGFVRCHACSKPMTGHRGSDGRPTYICQPKPRGCGKTKIGAEPMDALIRDAMLYRLDSPQLADALRARSAHEDSAVLLEELHADEQALEELAVDHYSRRIIGRGEYLAARQAIETRLTATRPRLARRNGMGMVSAAGTGEQLRATWHERGLEWQRSLVAAIIEKIVINPGRRGYNRFDENRVEVVWR